VSLICGVPNAAAAVVVVSNGFVAAAGVEASTVAVIVVDVAVPSAVSWVLISGEVYFVGVGVADDADDGTRRTMSPITVTTKLLPVVPWLSWLAPFVACWSASSVSRPRTRSYYYY
jgi:hypothetical protein